jgi:hypothetical protein
MPDTTAARRRFPNRKQDDVKEASGAAKAAREAGPHGGSKHADFSSQASPNKHKAPIKGVSGVPGRSKE